MPDSTQHLPPKRSTAGRVTALVASGLVALFALGFLAVGAGLLWADAKKDDQGYITSSKETYKTSTAAIATEQPRHRSRRRRRHRWS